MSDTSLQQFVEEVVQRIENDTFVKLTLSQPTEQAGEVKGVYVRLVQIKKVPKLSFTFRYARRDEVKNFEIAEGVQLIRLGVGTLYRAANLMTTAGDYVLQEQKGRYRMYAKPATCTAAPMRVHDVPKQRTITTGNGDKVYWQLLGLTGKDGQVLQAMQRKFRQIHRYIELVGESIASVPDTDAPIRIADMGAGKGYLTFALCEYLVGRGRRFELTGVEIRADLVAKCNDIARVSGLEGLHFVESSIEAYKPASLDVLIALHACDTATDDAIWQGMAAGAQLIVVAPCCHKHLRRQVHCEQALKSILRFGVFEERQCEMLTDGMRALLLEYAGYKTQVMEFIETEHTPKNILIVARKKSEISDKVAILQKITELKAYFGVDKHYLEQLMNL